jgi:hypothetical protein
MRFIRQVKNSKKSTIYLPFYRRNNDRPPCRDPFLDLCSSTYLVAIYRRIYKMNFKNAINIVHDTIITLFMVFSVYMLFNAEPLGAVIMLLAMIEDNVYKRR